MIITNKHNLPEAIYKALSTNDYDPGQSDYSVTTLIKTPRMVQLARRHADKVTVDAIDRLWSVLGTAVHNIFEANAEHGSTVEVRYYLDIQGKKVGGQVDHYKDGILSDYKVTKAYKVAMKKTEDWETQLNIYAYMLRKHGKPVHKIEVHPVLRDWDKMKSIADRNYPDHAFPTVIIPVWPDAKVEALLEERVRVHKNAESVDDNNLPLCSPVDTWERPTKYALMKNGNKKATKLFDDKLEAINFGKENW